MFIFSYNSPLAPASFGLLFPCLRHKFPASVSLQWLHSVSRICFLIGQNHLSSDVIVPEIASLLSKAIKAYLYSLPTLGVTGVQ